MIIRSEKDKEKVEELLLLNWKIELSNFNEKYTKSHYFLMPLFKLNKNCNKEFERHYVNTFIDDEEKPCHLDNCISLMFSTTDISGNESMTWERLRNNLFSHNSYKYHYYVGNNKLKNICIFVFKLPILYTFDYKLILEGKYSKTSKNYRQEVLNYFRQYKDITNLLVAIFKKSSWLKNYVEEKINVKGENKRSLIETNAEYWDVFYNKREIFRSTSN